MGDLISRSALIEDIDTQLKEIVDEVEMTSDVRLLISICEKFKKIVNRMPTAYDVEKVVAELEQQAEQYKRRALELAEKSTEAGIHNKGKSLSYENAIEIVRNGGKE